MRESWAFRRALYRARPVKKRAKMEWYANEHWYVGRTVYQGRLPMFITIPSWRDGKSVEYKVVRFS